MRAKALSTVPIKTVATAERGHSESEYWHLALAASSFIPSPSTGLQAGPRSSGSAPRQYRLVDGDGKPHPVLDDLYDSLELAWGEAQRWWAEQQQEDAHRSSKTDPVAIGVEVSTSCGSWRTLRHPGS